MIVRIGKVLRFNAKTNSIRVSVSALPYIRSIQKIATVDCIPTGGIGLPVLGRLALADGCLSQKSSGL